MSILLDAVIRNKQQGQLPDPATAPRPYVDHPQRWPVKAVAAVVLSLLAGGGAAFGLNLWLNKEEPVAMVLPAQEAEPASLIAMQAGQTNQPASYTQPHAVQVANDPGVRLAGRGNIPVARPGPVLSQQAAEPGRSSAAAPVKVAVQPAYSEPEASAAPLVLGANSDLTPQQLEILRRETGHAPQGMADLGQEAKAAQDNLLAAFEQALKDVEYQHSVKEGVTPAKLDPIPEVAESDFPRYGDLSPALQQQVPEFNIVAHVYASNPKNRWLNVDGRELQQGDTIGGKLKIVEIRPRDVVLEIAGTEFIVPAI
ncbi:general secretion pathway protein GspB [Shewanella sp. GXUN23E]|uniref:general secretion pathway protein GspB n=1 Tax=Shewanella sp. GXUN23E TaxID=3422498 RepID=UPI003D7D3B6C